MALSQDELSAWLWLLSAPGIGRGFARRLLAAFGSPQAVVGSSEPVLARLVGPDLAQALLQRPPALTDRVAATRQWLLDASAGAPRTMLTLSDPLYPRALLHAPDPPLALFASGRLELLDAPSVSIVGSRRATPQGRENSRTFARHLSTCGLTIVSGLAAGIDAAAHEGGLAASGSSVAFVGTGLDQVYPASNADLAERLAHEGLIVSEYLLGTPPLAANFPQRNRLIAGLSLGTVVVEAADRSGSLITARLAAEAGREVFAIPGSIHSPLSRGCHRLIQDGARLAASPDDILQELKLGIAPATPVGRRREPETAELESTSESPTAELPDDERLVVAMGHDPVTFDALAARTGLSGARLAALLLGLELTGRIHRLPGGLFQCQSETKGPASTDAAV